MEKGAFTLFLGGRRGGFRSAASLCAIATGAGAGLVIVNRDPTPYDMAATAVVRDPIGTAVPRMADQLLAGGRFA